MKQTTETTDLCSEASHNNTKTRKNITDSCPTVYIDYQTGAVDNFQTSSFHL